MTTTQSKPPRDFRAVIEERSCPEPNTGCWLWLGQSEAGLYGYVRDGRKTRRVHRVAYEAFVGPIPPGLTIDHTCKTTICVNPAHMEPVTLRENILRSSSPPAINARRTHCAAGHALSGSNLIARKDGGSRRRCRACYQKSANEGGRRRRALRNAQLAADAAREKT